MRSITFMVLAVSMFVAGYQIGKRTEPQEKPCVKYGVDDFDCMKLDGSHGWDYKLCYRARVKVGKT